MIGSSQDPAVAQLPARPQPSTNRVRSSQTRVLNLLRHGQQASPTLRRLVADLEASDLIVYVEPGICAFGHLAACLPHPISVANGTRYLRVIFDEHRRSASQSLALIGHELQHALEIARVPEARSAEAVTRLFARIGFSPHCPAGLPDCYETAAARSIGQRIQQELSDKPFR